MMKKIFFLLTIGFILLFPVMTALTQEETPSPPTYTPSLEITGVNPSGLPTAFITANVFDTLGQPLTGLNIDNFTLSGELANVGQIVQVESIADDNLPISAVLVIDISDSMSGYPLEKAKEAAIAFINSIGANDSVAIVTFASKVELAQNYTTEKTQLIGVIEGLQTGGRTALYSAGVVGVETVVNAPTGRRVVVLLSDGSEYGGASTNAREEALMLARQKGASFYTIGLGFGADRTYLEELALGTNGAFFESPEATQLTNIYTNIAQRLRNEYIITVNADVPLDGTIYGFDLQANTSEGATNIASGTLIAPVPVPVIRQMSEVDLTTPLTEQIQLWYLVIADDRPIAVETVLKTDSTITPIESTLFDSNYVIEIDPRNLAPGNYISSITVTDNNGDIAILDTPFSIASIPSEVSISGVTGGQQFEGMFTPDDKITLQADVIYSQTPITRVVYFLDGQEVAQTTDAPYQAELSLLEIGSGRKLIEAFVETQSQQLDVIAVEFFVNIIPTPTPTFTLTPTFTPSPTMTPSTTPTPTEAIDIFATETFVAQEATQSAFNVLSTQEARATAVQSQRDGRATALAEDLSNRATATSDANSTATRESELATVMVLATETAQIGTQQASTATFEVYFTETAVVAETNMTATSQAQATSYAEITMAIASATQFELDFRATERVVTETAVAIEEQITSTAQAIEEEMTATMQAIETELWLIATATSSTATAQAELDATMTLEAELSQSTAVAQANFNATATTAYDLTATATEIGVRMTLTALAIEHATQTAQVSATETAIAESELLLTATALMNNATETAQANIDATNTAIANITLTADYNDALTQVVISEQTQTALAVNAQATQQAISATETALAQPTSTPNPTLTPITELTEITAPDAPIPTQAITDFLPLICGGLIALAFLIMVLVIFVRRNN